MPRYYVEAWNEFEVGRGGLHNLRGGFASTGEAQKHVADMDVAPYSAVYIVEVNDNRLKRVLSLTPDGAWTDDFPDDTFTP